METNPSAEKLAFVRAFTSGQWTMSELCERYGVSRPTGYKWVKRFLAAGEAGLVERSRAPASCPHRTPAVLEQRLLAARARYGWGAGKLLQVLQRRDPQRPWPARSTANAILDRHGQLRKARRRRRWPHPGAGRLHSDRPNQIWPADFKGQFRTGDGRVCYPLTITDHYSRKLLLCRALASVRTGGVQPLFEQVFRRCGLPEAIRTDNGAPFASAGLQGLSALSVWWMKLGIVHQRIRPAHPAENGQHERMHRELKRETARPPATTMRTQQRRFDQFRRRYNHQRPHDALAGACPASRWRPSPRPYPARLLPPQYPGHWEIRRVSAAGTFRFHCRQLFLSMPLADEYIGLEEVGDGLWNILYYRTLLARMDERTARITSLAV